MKRLDAKGHRVDGPIDMKYPEQANTESQKADQRLSGAGEGRCRVTANGDGVTLRGDENVLELDTGDSYTTL